MPIPKSMDTDLSTAEDGCVRAARVVRLSSPTAPGHPLQPASAFKFLFFFSIRKDLSCVRRKGRCEQERLVVRSNRRIGGGVRLSEREPLSIFIFSVPFQIGVEGTTSQHLNHIRPEFCLCDKCHFFFNSSSQLTTTVIGVGCAFPEAIKNRWPPREISKG